VTPRRNRYLAGLWLARWGFALTVAVALAVSLTIAVTVPVPAELPSVALNAVAVYRLEVGAALFIGLYVAAMAFALAVQNRGFTEIGGGGVRAQDLSATLPELIAANEVVSERLSEAVESMVEAQQKLKEGQP
jgi:hypothetical protein